MKSLRLLLFPFSLLYGLGVIIRNLGYDLGLIKSRSFKIPLISIGNLAVGGSGKSPMAEYIIRNLKAELRVGVLSRGYGRKTKGFILLDKHTPAEIGGDEPVQFKRKFPELTIAVCESRIEGVERLAPELDALILDDAYQHRSLIPGLSLLLFDYNTLFDVDILLPGGNMREPWAGRRRANILVVTKCPDFLSEEERAEVTTVLNPYPHQQVFFTGLAYGELRPVFGNTVPASLTAEENPDKIFLLTGIANSKPLQNHLSGICSDVQHHRYPDHHDFTRKNIAKLADAYATSEAVRKIIVTTEKDARRLESAVGAELLHDLPVYYLPVEVYVHEPDSLRFQNLIREYASKPTTYN